MENGGGCGGWRKKRNEADGAGKNGRVRGEGLAGEENEGKRGTVAGERKRMGRGCGHCQDGRRLQPPNAIKSLGLGFFVFRVFL